MTWLSPGSAGWWSRWDPEWGGGFHPRCRESPCSPGGPSALWGTAGPCPHSPDSGSSSGPWWVWAETQKKKKTEEFRLFTTTVENQEAWTASRCHANMRRKTTTAADTDDRFQTDTFCFDCVFSNYYWMLFTWFLSKHRQVLFKVKSIKICKHLTAKSWRTYMTDLTQFLGNKLFDLCNNCD